MIEVIYCILLTAFFVNGLNIATGEGMIFDGVKKFLHTKIGENKIYKPLIGCIKCMPSIYGTIICLCFLPFHVELFYQIPVVIACSSTVATIIHAQYI